VTDQHRDWDKELAEIDRQIARVPAGQPARASSALPPGRRAVFTTWLRVLLGLAVAGGITQWPYLHDCGLNLLFYEVAIGTVIVAGVWSSITSWQRRLGLAHFLSLLVLLWGLVLSAREILPRVGYAKVSANWLCP